MTHNGRNNAPRWIVYPIFLIGIYLLFVALPTAIKIISFYNQTGKFPDNVGSGYAPILTMIGVIIGFLSSFGFVYYVTTDWPVIKSFFSTPFGKKLRIVLLIAAIAAISFFIGQNNSNRSTGLAIEVENWNACVHLIESPSENEEELIDSCSSFDGSENPETNTDLEPPTVKYGNKLVVSHFELVSVPKLKPIEYQVEEEEEYWTKPIKTLQFIWDNKRMSNLLENGDLSGKPMNGVISTIRVTPFSSSEKTERVYCRYLMIYNTQYQNESGEYKNSDLWFYGPDQHIPFTMTTEPIALVWDFTAYPDDNNYYSLDTQLEFTRPFLRFTELWQWAEYHPNGKYQADRIKKFGIECLVSASSGWTSLNLNAPNTFVGDFEFGNIEIFAYDYEVE